MNWRHPSFLYWSTIACLLLAIALNCIKAQPCSSGYYYHVSVAAPPLSPSVIISNHTVHIVGECYIHCTKEEKCFGFNYREKKSNENTLNCQLSNSTKTWNRTETGEWVHYQDVRVIEDIDECSQDRNKCDSNRYCINTPGSYVCHDIDECSGGNHTCDPNATCTNTEGSYQCQCNSGYTGDGHNCTDFDECSGGNHTCDPNATCTNTEGSYQCQCDTGYAGDGHNCTDIDECSRRNHTCDPNATCTNTDGSYQCQCDTGYTGDGDNCTAQLNLTIYIRSEGANDPGLHGKGHASIQLNGAEKAKRRRGYNVVVVNGETGVVESSKAFDTYGNNSAPLDLIGHLDSIQERKLVLVAIQDEGSKKMTDAAYEALERFGATNQLRKKFRSSFALLGYSGPGQFDAITQVQQLGGEGPSTISKVTSLPL